MSPGLREDDWTYDPAESRRDLRLDFLRGLCLLKMVFNHLWHTPLHVVQQWLGYVTAAEAFFFISGAVVGIVHGRRARQQGLGVVSRQVLTRALQLYLANLAFVFLFASMEASGWLAKNWYLGLWSGGFHGLALFRFDQPYYLAVLPRYVAFLALTPLALWCLLRRRSLWLLAATFGVWGANLLLGLRLKVPILEVGRDFPIASWQVLFFVGMVLGFHRQRLAQGWRRLSGGPWLVGLAAGAVGFVLLRRAQEAGMLSIPGHWVHFLVGREQLGPLRLLNLAVTFTFLFELTHRYWSPLKTAAGRVLLP
ncbi:MAG: OpgC domain-containing protein, partial [Acidobacteria bacterium]|nr:OpgC domain-containing protein [Acidobacteriota bacterium]